MYPADMRILLNIDEKCVMNGRNKELARVDYTGYFCRPRSVKLRKGFDKSIDGFYSDRVLSGINSVVEC